MRTQHAHIARVAGLTFAFALWIGTFFVPTQVFAQDEDPPPPIPECGPLIISHNQMEYACENWDGSGNQCSFFVRDFEYERWETTNTYQNGVVVSCAPWTLTGNCCWAFGFLPGCPGSTCFLPN